MTSELLKCTRCKVNVRISQWTGCLCEKCEKAIENMTQAELDKDYKRHAGDKP